MALTTEEIAERQKEVNLEGASDFRLKMEFAGIDDVYLIKKLKEELDALDIKFFADKGKVVDSRDIAAWKIRQEARKDAHKLRGDYPSEKHDISGTITYLSHVPEPQPLPEEENDVDDSK